MVLRDDVGDDGVEGGAEERRGRAVDGGQDDHVPQLERPGDGERRERADRQGPHDVGGDHDMTPVDAVADRAAQ
jgi:hypothetical protein